MPELADLVANVSTRVALGQHRPPLPCIHWWGKAGRRGLGWCTPHDVVPLLVAVVEVVGVAHLAERACGGGRGCWGSCLGPPFYVAFNGGKVPALCTTSQSQRQHSKPPWCALTVRFNTTA